MVSVKLFVTFPIAQKKREIFVWLDGENFNLSCGIVYCRIVFSLDSDDPLFENRSRLVEILFVTVIYTVSEISNSLI